MKKKIIATISIICLLIIFSITVIVITKESKKEIKEEDIKEPVIKEQTNEIIPPLTAEINTKTLTPEDVHLQDKTYIITYYDNSNNEITFKETYNQLGTYKVTIISKDEIYETTITIKDSEKPVLKLKEVTIKQNETYKQEDFVLECIDNYDKECTIKMITEVDTAKIGTYEIEIEASDNSNNKIIEKTKLIIKENKKSTSNKKEDQKPTENKKEESSVKPKPEENKKPTEDKKEDQKPTEDKKEEDKEPEKEEVPKPTLVEKKTEKKEEELPLKYGVTKTVITTTTYDLYSDGSKKNIKTSSETKYNYSKFNAKSLDLKEEAIKNKSTYRTEINEILKYTNEYRKEAGVSSLVLSEDITTAAMIRAIEMSYSRVFDHTRPNGTSFSTVLSDLNLRFTSMAGENIAYASYKATPEKISDLWKNSAGHYKNMINSGFTKIGIGYATLNGQSYWVQIFAN